MSPPSQRATHQMITGGWLFFVQPQLSTEAKRSSTTGEFFVVPIALHADEGHPFSTSVRCLLGANRTSQQAFFIVASFVVPVPRAAPSHYVSLVAVGESRPLSATTAGEFAFTGGLQLDRLALSPANYRLPLYTLRSWSISAR